MVTIYWIQPSPPVQCVAARERSPWLAEPGSKEYRLVVCTGCGQHFTDPPPTPEEILAFYQGDYHQDLRRPGATEQAFGTKFCRYRDWIFTIVPVGHSMDVGTATGLFPSLLRQAGFDASGTEYNPASAEWGTAHYGIPIRLGGLEQIALQQLYDTQQLYDFISMTDVLEHTVHPLDALKTASQLLNPRAVQTLRVGLHGQDRNRLGNAPGDTMSRFEPAKIHVISHYKSLTHAVSRSEYGQR